MTDIDRQIQDYLQQLEINSESAEVHASLSSLYAQKQQWHEAIIAAQKAISIDPKFAGAYRNLARIFTRLDKQSAATECWFQAYNLEPSRWSAKNFYDLGELLLEQKRFDRALICYLQALKLRSDYAEAYWKSGLILTRQGKYNEATEAYRRAIELCGRNEAWQKEVFAAYRHNLSINPKSTAREFYELGKLLRARNFIAEAISIYNKALEIDPLLMLVHSDLSYTNIPDDLLPELIESYRKIIIKYPYFSEAWSNLGDFFTQQGKTTEATFCYQKSCYYQTIKNRPYLVAWVWGKNENSAPDFIIAGATKCGTTSLYKYLELHPQVIVSRKKEINFFHKYFSLGLDWYLSQFPFLDDPSFLTGEASPNYLDFPIAAKNTYEMFPQAKLIFLLRNPIEKAISWHYHKLDKGLEKDSLQEAVDKEIKSLSSLSAEQLAQTAYRIPNNILGSLYYYRLQSWFAVFPREQILVLKSEYFYQDTAGAMSEVYKFLKLKPHQLAKYPIWNSGNYSTIDPETRKILADYFRPHNQKLEEFLERKFDWD